MRSVCEMYLILSFLLFSPVFGVVLNRRQSSSYSIPPSGAFPFFTPFRDGDSTGFSVVNSSRRHNRPLYGPWNGGLVLTGDLPFVHLADDKNIYGGFLFGLCAGGSCVWAHDFAVVNVSYSAGSMRWVCSDTALLPGLELEAAVYAASEGVGFVFDLNVSSAYNAASNAELIWAWGCAAPVPSGPTGWKYDPLVNGDTALAWDFSPASCKGNVVALGSGNTSATTSFSGGNSASISLATTAPENSLVSDDASGWKNVSALGVGRLNAGTPLSSSALPLPGATLWLRASSLSLPNGSAVSSWSDESGGGAVFTQTNASLRPTFLSQGFPPHPQPGLSFDGLSNFLESATATEGGGRAPCLLC